MTDQKKKAEKKKAPQTPGASEAAKVPQQASKGSAAASAKDTGAEPLLRVTDLVKHFPITKGLLKRKVGAVQAVDGLSFDVYPGRPWASSASRAAASRPWAG